jgi:L-fuculose-phosphate aldolase
MRRPRDLRTELVATAVELHRRAWVANHDGNVTARVAPGRFLTTPTATSKGRVSARDLIEVDSAGKTVAGTGRPFGELPMHLAIYRQREDVHAVLHAHPPHATAIACAGRNLIERPFIAEAVVSLGERIPLLPFSPPGEASVQTLTAQASAVDAVLLESHGVFTWGADLEQALLRMELVEHLARIALLAVQVGGVKPLPAEAIAPLLQARARAGLGKAAEKATALPPSWPLIACAPAPHAAAMPVDLPALIREELERTLRGR